VLGIAAGLERFDTRIKITDRESGRSIFIDGEGSFNLPETQTIPILYGAMRINKKHSIGFHAFSINRNGTSLQVDEDFGRLNVNGSVSMSDKTSFSYLKYDYALFDDGRTAIRALLGIYGLDLDLQMEANGQISIDGIPVQSGTYSEGIKQFAALPLIGLDYWSSVTDRWFIGAKVAAIKGSYDKISATVVEASIRARYKMTNRVSLITGVNYLRADVTIKKTSSIRDTRYGYDGVFLGLDFNF
jgi:hypothetical protein